MATLIAILSQHLGLTVEASKIVSKISKCPKCLSFWITLAALIYNKCDPLKAIALSFIMAYLSFWLSLLFPILQKAYNRIWTKLNKK